MVSNNLHWRFQYIVLYGHNQRHTPANGWIFTRQGISLHTVQEHGKMTELG